MNPSIVGWAHSPFGRRDGEALEDMIVEVARDAIAHAGIAPTDIDAIYLGHFNGGFSEQDFTAALILEADAGLRFKPATRVENACASGSAAVFQGVDAIRAGRARTVLVVGAEKMTDTKSPQVGQNLLRASYLKEEAGIEAGFAGLFGMIADRYFQTYGDKSNALARIAAKNHRNGVDNPFAQMRKDLGYDFCRAESEKNPLVAGPLKRTDCSLVSDGAAALVIASNDVAQAMPRSIRFRGMAHVQDFLPMSSRDLLKMEGCALAWQKALADGGIALSDLSFVETHDCFTIAELIEYEAMGLVPYGQGERVALEGWVERDGRLPINRSGGLKAKGHPIGATGVSMHVLTAMQLLGEAPPDLQLPNPIMGGIFNMGGAAVANYTSILEAAR
ncbi:acetyl-CoA acetyltransferase [Sinorhizobium fredii]|uniref:acetyl-CoA acetyltransferase n=1 Tax=Rhizobium fredii TaxID=380 RepID=UPI0005956BFB|nr:acetyl-CoA acetyltransferase [Sinorhizobium fredii]WOS65483.1 acetyl-CoA acetyltransferase [Sinorhizobium fredii GR64]